MAKRPSSASAMTREFSDNGARQMMGAANFGADWFREIANEGLNQSKAVQDGYFAISKRAFENVDRQAIDMNKRSMLVAEETLSNAFDFAHRLVSVRERQQLATLQSEFASRQAEIFADQMKMLSQNAMQSGSDFMQTARHEAERSRKRSAR